jgi:hypothetical protein
MRNKIIIFLIIGLIIVTGCGGNAEKNDETTQAQVEATATDVPLPEIVPTNTTTLIEEPTITPTLEATAEPTATRVPTLPWTTFTGGSIKAPILLYYSIGLNDDGLADFYHVTIENFEKQMQTLSMHGYETVTTDQLVDVIWSGGSIPERPVVITFDYGNSSVYEEAFPIMEKYGFVGSVYYVASWFGLEESMTTPQILELTDAGWSLGSMSYTHRSMVTAYLELQYEMRMSKLRLEELFGVDVNTFAYPYGEMNEYVGGKVGGYGYTGAVGLGESIYQGLFNVYYLSRIEVHGFMPINDFLKIFDQ